MSKLKFALALLGAGGMAALASEAEASTVVTLDLNYASPPTDIALIGGSPAQFYYGEGIDKIAPGEFIPDVVLGAYGSAALGLTANTPGMPVVGESFGANQVKVGPLIPQPPVGELGYFGPADAYVHLTFTDSGKQYVGAAHVDGAGTLRTIEYVDAPAAPGGVPEPAEWALLIGGLGLAGAALRRQRQALAAQ
jgi:hypothetical protein